VELDLGTLGIGEDEVFQVHDLLSEQRYEWRGRHNFVMLEPWRMPAHVFLLRKLLRSERNFDYFS
jgi:starch synthase (maltosyl-transferring)